MTTKKFTKGDVAASLGQLLTAGSLFGRIMGRKFLISIKDKNKKVDISSRKDSIILITGEIVKNPLVAIALFSTGLFNYLKQKNINPDTITDINILHKYLVAAGIIGAGYSGYKTLKKLGFKVK
jgi:hypothetical protein